MYNKCRGMLCLVVSLSFLSGLPATAAAEERVVEVVALNYLVPEQVVPAIKAVLPAGATVTAFNNQLILKVTKAEQATVKKLLEQLDKAPRQFLITVRTPSALGIQDSEISASGSFAKGKVRIGSGEHKGRVIIRSDSASSSGQGRQSVRATEGLPAYIAVGESVPVTTVRTTGKGNKETITEYKPADRGFYVTVRLTGDTVTLDIDQKNDRHQNNSFDTRRVKTTLSGRLGNWITIAGTGSVSNGRKNGLVVRSSSASSGSGTVQLLVEQINP